MASKRVHEDIPLLIRKFKDISSDWDLYGSMLSIPNARLQAIRRRDSLSSDECMVRMLQMWGESTDSASYQNLYHAAKNMEHNSLARKIQQAHPNLQEKVDINNMDQLISLLEPMISRWEYFGLQLGISEYKLQTINDTGHYDDDNLRKLFSVWIDIKDEEAYFEDLVKALRQPAICNNALAQRIVRDEDIKKRFGTPVTVQQILN